ncbi:MAG: hypothetical protein K2K89_13045 [Ruminococcus sp.]|nr:hypothetical protein [Ruminococcus sp.]
MYIIIAIIQIFWGILCEFGNPYVFFALLAVMGLLGFFMESSRKNTLIKTFIIIGDIFQIYWEYLIFLISCLFTFPRGTASETMDGTEYYYDPEMTFLFIIVIPIFFLLAFLPYRINRRLYNNCYSYRKMSENWIFPSRLISIITVTLYFAVIIDFLIESTGIFRAMTAVAHTVIFVLIARSFFLKKIPCENNSRYNSVIKFLSVILNTEFGVTAFLCIKLGLSLICPDECIEDVHLLEYITGVIISEVAIFLPYGMNLLLYKPLYRKNGLSKWWTFPSILLSAGAFLIYWYGLTINY